jgi:hypothetical protein
MQTANGQKVWGDWFRATFVKYRRANEMLFEFAESGDRASFDVVCCAQSELYKQLRVQLDYAGGLMGEW